MRSASNIIFNLPLQKNQLFHLLCSTQIYDKMTIREGKIMRDNIILSVALLEFLIICLVWLLSKITILTKQYFQCSERELYMSS